MEGNFGATKIWRNWQPTQNSPNFHHPKFHTSIDSHVNIAQIDWKIFLRHVLNNLQVRYHWSPLDSHAWPVDRVNFQFLVHKVSFYLQKDYPIYIDTHGSLESLNLYKTCVNCHFTFTIKLPDIVAICM